MEWFFGRREAREICNSGYPACTLIFATRQAMLNGDDATAIAVGREALLARDFPTHPHLDRFDHLDRLLAVVLVVLTCGA